MSNNLKTALLTILFILLSFYFYLLSFPTKEALQIAKQSAQKEFGVSWNEKSFLDLGVVGVFSNVTITNNSMGATIDNAYYLNLGVVIVGVVNDIKSTQKIIDFNIDKLILIYSPLMPKSLSLFGFGNFGDIKLSLYDSIISIVINPTERFIEFKNTPLGSKILDDFKTTPDGLEANYAL